MPDIGSLASGTALGNVTPIARSGNESSNRIGPPHSAAPTTESRRTDGRDRVELSEHARSLDALRSMPEVRMEKVNEIRAAIAAGLYETDDKIAVAVERLLQELDG